MAEFDDAGWGSVPSNDPRQRGTGAGSGGGYDSVPSKDARPDFAAPGVPSNGYANSEGFDPMYDAQLAPRGNQPTPKRGPTGMKSPVAA